MAAKIIIFIHRAGASGMIEEKNERTKVLTIVSKGTCGSVVAINGSASFSVGDAPSVSFVSGFSGAASPSTAGCSPSRTAAGAGACLLTLLRLTRVLLLLFNLVWFCL